MWGLLGTALTWLLGLIWPAKDSCEEERKAGERIGVAETTSNITTKELDNAKEAVDASRRAGAFDDAGGLRQQRPGEQPWDPDGIG